MQCWTNTWLWLDQHLRRRPSTNPTHAYCNVLRLLGSQSSLPQSNARTSVGLIWGQFHRRCVNIRTTSRRDITDLWSLYPASQQTRDIVPILVHRLRRWPNIEPTMGQCIVFAGLNEPSTPVCFTHGGGEHPMQYQRPGKHAIEAMLGQLSRRWPSIGSMCLVCWDVIWRHRQGQCLS